MRLCLVVGLALPMSLGLTSRLMSATISLVPTADAFVAQSKPDSNFGGAGNLAVSGSGNAKGEFKTLMRYDFSVAKSGFDMEFGAGSWQAESLTLTLKGTSPSNALFNPNSAGSFDISVMQSNSWAEGTGNPNAPTTDGITYNTLPGYLASGTTPVSVLQYDQGITATTYQLNFTPNLAFRIQHGDLTSFYLQANDASMSYLFNSRSFGTASDRPTLTISARESATPEPSSLIAVIGCIMITSVRRKT